MARFSFGRFVQPISIMPRALAIGIPVATPIAQRIGEPLTNIDATDLAHQENIARIRAAQQGNLPTAQRLDQGPIPDPLWISRAQSSPNPPNAQGVVTPWVKGYRWWVPDTQYVSWYEAGTYRLDFKWKDHQHAYHKLPYGLWEHFRAYTGGGGSPGVWFHANILPPGWKPGRGAMYPNFEL